MAVEGVTARRRRPAADALHRRRTRRPAPQAGRGAGGEPPEEPRQRPLLGVRPDPEIDDLVAQTFASRKMVEKYDQMRAQSKINADEATCLQDEKNAVLNYESRLRDKLTEAMERGTGVLPGCRT